MVALIIPVLNGGKRYASCLDAIDRQDVTIHRKLVIDSGSTDGSQDLSREHGFEVHEIPKAEFNHGGTRWRAAQMVDDDIIVLLTQDAIIAGEAAVSELLAPFKDPAVGAAYGRQLPHEDADLIATHTRLKSYKDESYVTDLDDAHPAGIRKCFMSNSFAAYRRSALQKIGGFADNLIMAEDMDAAAKMLLVSYKIAYVAGACVRHSHNYTVAQEFRRYFDIGVFQREQSWIGETFGTPTAEGRAFAIDQVRFLALQGAYGQIPRSIFTSAAKLLGYKLGRSHRMIGRTLSRRMAMHRNYFAPEQVPAR